MKKILIILMVLVSTHLYAQGKKWSIAVLDLKANNVPQSYSKIVRNFVEVALFKTGRYQLVEWEQIQKVLHNLKLKGDYSKDINNIIRVGSTLSSDFMIAGSIDKIKNYRVTLRVISVKDRRIIVVYSRQLRAADDIEVLVNRISKDIASDVWKYIKTGKIKNRRYSIWDFEPGIRFSYCVPVGDFASLVNPGPGFSVQADMNNVFFNHFFLGVGFSAWWLMGAENSSDSLTLTLLTLRAGYHVKITDSIDIVPTISLGTAFLHLKHGTDSGFDMTENTERDLIEPIVAIEVQCRFMPVQNFYIILTPAYGFIVESKPLHFVSLSLGLAYAF